MLRDTTRAQPSLPVRIKRAAADLLAHAHQGSSGRNVQCTIYTLYLCLFLTISMSSQIFLGSQPSESSNGLLPHVLLICRAQLATYMSSTVGFRVLGFVGARGEIFQ